MKLYEAFSQLLSAIISTGVWRWWVILLGLALVFQVARVAKRRLDRSRRDRVPMMCGACQQPTKPETSAYHEALAVLVCFG